MKSLSSAKYFSFFTALLLFIGLLVGFPASSIAAGEITGTKPTISGTAQVGSTLSESDGPWTPGDVTITRQWYRGGVPISGATGSTYTLTDADAGKAVWVKVTADKSGYDGKSLHSELVLVKNVNSTGNKVLGWGSNDNDQTSIPAGLTDVVSVAAGAGHSLALKSDGTVVAWGNNGSGQTDVPAGLKNVVAISAGQYVSAALKSDGTIAVWGSNDYAQQTIPEAATSGVVAISASFHLMALKADGTVVSWGYNDYLQANVPAGLSDVIAVAAGGEHSLALKSDGSVVSWGHNVYGETVVPDSAKSSVIAIAGNDYTSLALKSDGSVINWGYDDNGKWSVPKGMSGISAIAAGWLHRVVLSEDGRVTAWGGNNYGEGDVPWGLFDVLAIAAGQNHTLVVQREPITGDDPTITGTAEYGKTLTVDAGTWSPEGISINFQWYRGGKPIAGATSSTYKLIREDIGEAIWVKVIGTKSGHAKQERYSSLKLVKPGSVTTSLSSWGESGSDDLNVPDDVGNVVNIANGFYHSLALTSEGTVLAWGTSIHGQTDVPDDLSNVVGIAGGGFFSVALKSDGTVVAWEVGSDPKAPAVPAGLSNVVAIAAEGSQILALRADGSVFGWGSNLFGESTLPYLVDVVDLAAGWTHSAALRADGTVVAWGNELQQRTAVPDGLSGVVDISAKGDHTLALKSNGTVVAWGDNQHGERDVPVGLTKVSKIAAGAFTSLALKEDGTLVRWGYDYGGCCQIPDGIGNVVQISGSGYSQFALSMQFPTLTYSNPTISGTAEVGNELTANAGTWEPAGVSLSYQWYRGGMPIKDASNSKYTLTAADRGHPVWVEITGTKEGYETSVAKSTMKLVKRPGEFQGWIVPWGDSNNDKLAVPDDLTDAVALSAGGVHSLALRSNGSVVGWGANGHDQYTIPAEFDDVVAVSAGGHHSLILNSDGSVAGFGGNGQGQVTIPDDAKTDVVAIAAGDTHSLALKSDGTVVAWGSNADGRATVPAGLSGVVAISARGYHSAALKSDGTVVVWGNNEAGQTTVPVDLPGASAIAAGGTNTMVLSNSKSVKAWGFPGQDKVPSGLASVMSIAAGGSHMLALKEDGTVVAWGGDNDKNQRNIPAGLADVLAISAGWDHSLALTTTLRTLSGTVPTISGPLSIGETLSAEPGTWTLGSSFTYQWYRGTSPIVGATGSTYTLVAGDADKNIKVKLTGAKIGYAELSRESALTTKILLSSKPLISGSMSVGSTLTSSFTKNSWAAGTKFSYQWLRDGEAISKATGSSYKLTSSDAGKVITLRVTGNKPGYVNVVQTSNSGPKVMSPGTPTITGAVKIGETLSVDAGNWSPGTSFTYQWLRNGVAIAGATSSTYSVTQNDENNSISVRVVGEKTDYASITRSSLATAKVMKSGTPTVTGSLTVGSTLGVSRGSWSSKVGFSYQWLRDGQSINKATKSTYNLTGSDAGKVITVLVTGKRSGYATVVTTSASGSKVIIASTPKISGTVVVGGELTAIPGVWSVGTQISYEWFSGGIKVKGADTSTYEVRSDDVDKVITVKVTGRLTDYWTESRTSAGTAKVMASTQPSITGDVVVGSTLGVDRGTWSDKVAFSYQWLRDGKTISKATKSTYKLTSTDMGKAITVRVTGKRSGYATVVLTSAPVPR